MDNSVLRVSYQSILQQGKKLTLYRPDGGCASIVKIGNIFERIDKRTIDK